jgi:hypothetical protein
MAREDRLLPGAVKKRQCQRMLTLWRSKKEFMTASQLLQLGS